MTPRAAPSVPSTVTSRLTLRDVALPLKVTSSSSTLLRVLKKLPNTFDLLFDGLEALILDGGGSGPDPVFRGLQVLDGFGFGLHLAGSGKPFGEGEGHRSPLVFALGELLLRLLAEELEG